MDLKDIYEDSLEDINEPPTDEGLAGEDLAAEEMACTDSVIPTAEPEIPCKPAYTETIRYESAERFRRTTTLVLLIALIGGAALGFGYGAGVRIASDIWIPRLTSDAYELRGFSLHFGYASAQERPEIYSFADVIEMVKPAVVRIQSLRGVTGTFQRRAESAGQGTGMIFHETANRIFIVTNAHVVMDADLVYISIGYSSMMPAAVVGKDNSVDLAVISVTRAAAHHAGVTSFTLVSFGDSDRVRVGDMVVAIGNALGEGISSTNGILSARDRTIIIDGMQYSVLQTNAAINHGNSGGPLVALTGEVIGMNTAKLKRGDRDDNVEGMGYSIPSNDMLPAIENIMRGTNAFLGVRVVSVNDDFRESLGLDEGLTGALITGVFANSAAKAAGLMPNDVVIEFDGTAIHSNRDLTQNIQSRRPGDTVTLRVLRGDALLEIEAVLDSE